VSVHFSFFIETELQKPSDSFSIPERADPDTPGKRCLSKPLPIDGIDKTS
jgi:hypothetical protein